MLAYLRVPLSWPQVLRRTADKAMADRCFGMAAQLAYYFFFALFPALLALIALASYFPLERLIDEMVLILAGFIAPEAISLITDQIQKISEGEEGGLLTFGMLLALWTTSTAMTAIVYTLDAAYDIQDSRPWWRVRLLATALTITVSVFILVSFALVMVGPPAARWIADLSPAGIVFVWTWNILQWPIVFALASLGIALIYYFAPDAEQDWVWLTPGSIFATSLWLTASLGFRYYVVNMATYTETYGVIGGVMVLLVWFYITGLAILLGAEMNAVIEHASLYGKDPGEKVPGQRRPGPVVIRRAA